MLQNPTILTALPVLSNEEEKRGDENMDLGPERGRSYETQSVWCELGERARASRGVVLCTVAGK